MSKVGGAWKLGAALVLLAWLALRWLPWDGVTTRPVTVETSASGRCVGTIWSTALPPKAVILIGHGVTCNQGMMAGLAADFAARGYTAVTLDFWGHGRSRVRFAWRENPEQVRAWCAWARAAYPGLPLAYLGHSMGGFAGAEAFAAAPLVDAFVSLGALPPRFPTVKTLVAAGRFEELFSPAEAREKSAGKADVIISPYSNHMVEPWDPLLIRDIAHWVDTALGVPGETAIAWGLWARHVFEMLLGGLSAFLVAGSITARLRGPAASQAPVHTDRPQQLSRWNLYRVAGRLLGVQGGGQAPRGASGQRAALLGVLYGVVLALGMALVLDRDVFTTAPTHPARLLLWLLCSAALWPLFWLNEKALEQLHYRHTWQRFAVPAITRAVPILLGSITVRLLVPSVAFGTMILGILGFVAALIALVYALATQAAGDSRAGAIAASVYLAWVTAFWVPLMW